VRLQSCEFFTRLVALQHRLDFGRFCNKELVISPGKSTICDVLPNNETASTRESRAFAELGPLANAIQALFQPFARILARRGVGARSTNEMIKRAYVAATADVLRERNLPVTPARLSVFTGLTQREVEQTQDPGISSYVTPPEVSRGEVVAVLTAWHEDPRYCVGFTGTPMELEFDAPAPKPSFTSLARELAPSQSPKELLEILVRAGAARLNESSGRVQVVARALISEPDSLESITRLGRMVRHLAETSYYNARTLDLSERRFNRNAIADFSLAPEVEEEFRKHVQAEGQRFLVSLDTWLKKQKSVPNNGRRVGVAAFYYVEPRDEAIEQQSTEVSQSGNVVDTPVAVSSKEPSGADDDSNPNFIDVLNYKGPKS
jgi:hypothetical protein